MGPTPCLGGLAAGTSCAMTPQRCDLLRSSQKRLLGTSGLVRRRCRTQRGICCTPDFDKFLYDRGHITDEPFKFMINQGMILGRSSFVYRIQGTNTFVSANQRKAHRTQRLHVDINLVEGDTLDLEGFKSWRPEFADAEFILDEDGTYTCGHEVEKMSNQVQRPNPRRPCRTIRRRHVAVLRNVLGAFDPTQAVGHPGISASTTFCAKRNGCIARLWKTGWLKLPRHGPAHRPQGHSKVTDDWTITPSTPWSAQ